VRRLKRALFAVGGMATAVAAFGLLLAASTILVIAGTGANPTDAFRDPELQNTSLSAELVWSDGTINGRLGPLESDALADAWADAIALVERRSNGETVDFVRRFDPSTARSLEHDGSLEWSPFSVVEHRITLDLVTTNRQVVAITADVALRRTVAGTSFESVDTYEAVLANGDSGWVVVTINRTASSVDAADT
jgi:hypothetical protein